MKILLLHIYTLIKSLILTQLLITYFPFPSLTPSLPPLFTHSITHSLIHSHTFLLTYVLTVFLLKVSSKLKVKSCFCFILRHLFRSMTIRKFHIRRNNNKVHSIEIGRTIIAHLRP